MIIFGIYLWDFNKIYKGKYWNKKKIFFLYKKGGL